MGVGAARAPAQLLHVDAGQRERPPVVLEDGAPRRLGVGEPAQRREQRLLLRVVAHAELLQQRRREHDEVGARAEVALEGVAVLRQTRVGGELAAVAPRPALGRHSHAARAAAGGELAVDRMERAQLHGGLLLLLVAAGLLDAHLAARRVRLEDRRQLQPHWLRQRRLRLAHHHLHLLAAERAAVTEPARRQPAGGLRRRPGRRAAAAATGHGGGDAQARRGGRRRGGRTTRLAHHRMPQLHLGDRPVAVERLAQRVDGEHVGAAAGEPQRPQRRVRLERRAQERAPRVADRAAAQVETRQPARAAALESAREAAGAPRADTAAAPAAACTSAIRATAAAGTAAAAAAAVAAA